MMHFRHVMHHGVVGKAFYVTSTTISKRVPPSRKKERKKEKKIPEKTSASRCTNRTGLWTWLGAGRGGKSYPTTECQGSNTSDAWKQGQHQHQQYSVSKVPHSGREKNEMSIKNTNNSKPLKDQ